MIKRMRLSNKILAAAVILLFVFITIAMFWLRAGFQG